VKPFFWFEIAFAVEPVLHGELEFVQGDAVAGFEEAVGSGEGIVEDGIIGEVAHGEVVDPVDRTQVRLAFGVDAFDTELPDEHGGR
jgi:hypothetical protein